MPFDPRISLVGFIVGTFVGMSGIGGGSMLVPLLVLVMRVKPSLAIGTDLLYSVPTKLLAFGLHARRGNVDWPLTRALLVGGGPGAIGGLGAYAILRAHVDEAALQMTLRHAIGIAILLACAGAMVTWFVRRRSRLDVLRRDDAAAPHGYTSATIMAVGAVVGFLVSITSIGSGSITLPLLVFAVPALTLRRLIGCEIAFAAFLVPIAAFGHASIGDVDYRLALGLLVGSLPGVWLGSRLSTVLNDGWLRPIIVGALAFAGSRLV
ncbi:MAG: sulfite exporter TauE/SafE family protein [Vulcanimicrobiaceae bacterium]